VVLKHKEVFYQPRALWKAFAPVRLQAYNSLLFTTFIGCVESDSFVLTGELNVTELRVFCKKKKKKLLLFIISELQIQLASWLLHFTCSLLGRIVDNYLR
jgi:hypothetical protein